MPSSPNFREVDRRAVDPLAAGSPRHGARKVANILGALRWRGAMNYSASGAIGADDACASRTISSSPACVGGEPDRLAPISSASTAAAANPLAAQAVQA